MSSEWPEVRLGDELMPVLEKYFKVKKTSLPSLILETVICRWGSFDLVNLAKCVLDPVL